MHANRFVCKIEKNAVCFKQDCFRLKFFFGVVYVNGGGVKVDEHCNYRLLVWERYVDVVRLSFSFFLFKSDLGFVVYEDIG